MIVTINGVEHHITHLMADGRVMESIEGYLTSYDQLAPEVQTVIYNIIANRAKEMEKEDRRKAAAMSNDR